MEEEGGVSRDAATPCHSMETEKLMVVVRWEDLEPNFDAVLLLLNE